MSKNDIKATPEQIKHFERSGDLVHPLDPVTGKRFVGIVGGGFKIIGDLQAGVLVIPTSLTNVATITGMNIQFIDRKFIK